MSRFLIWGTGKAAKEYYELFSKIEIVHCNEVVGFVDSDSGKWNKFFSGRPIIAPSDILRANYDYIDIWSPDYKKEILGQITGSLNIPLNRIRDIFAPYKQLLHSKYAASADTEIQEILKRMEQKGGLDIFYYQSEKKGRKLQEAFYDDSAGMHYIFFEGKRMYLKKAFHSFVEVNGKKYVGDFWEEQDNNSPHLYEGEKINVQEGDILVDAGVCEGNFSLHHIDQVKKVYLVECDRGWMEALYRTFLPFQSKVIFCNKFLSGYDSDKTICLDTLVTGAVNFIKMDIEGGEVDALEGARRILDQNCPIQCAICSYHRHGDEKAVRQILEKHNFEVSVSKGYMLYLFDEYVLNQPELRRGIVRGSKVL